MKAGKLSTRRKYRPPLRAFGGTEQRLKTTYKKKAALGKISNTRKHVDPFLSPKGNVADRVDAGGLPRDRHAPIRLLTALLKN